MRPFRGGICRPLCQHGKLEPAEACRLCLVEVEGRKSAPWRPCGLMAGQGMRWSPLAPVSHGAGGGLPPASGRALRRLPGPLQPALPANIDIQGYIALIARGRFVEATQLIRETNPLP